MNADGNTQYVDSATTGVPGYLAGGGAGGTNNGVTTMMDAPMPSAPAAAGALQAAVNAGLIPPGSVPIRVKFRFDFETYLVVDGYIAWVWLWYAEWIFDLSTNSVHGACRGVASGPASGLSANQQNALNNFLGGGFAGAPNP